MPFMFASVVLYKKRELVKRWARKIWQLLGRRRTSLLTWLKAQGLHLGVFVAAIVFLSNFAALRGTQRRPFPPFLDKLLRLTFLSSLTTPTLVYLPVLSRFPRLRALLWAVLFTYIPSYLDGTEKNCGRPSSWAKKGFPWSWFKQRFSLKLVRGCSCVEHKSTNPEHKTSSAGETQLIGSPVSSGEQEPSVSLFASPQQSTVSRGCGGQELRSTRQHIFGIHPHGFLPFGGVSALMTPLCGFQKMFPQVEMRMLAASFVFYPPIYRDLCLAVGMCDAARYSARRILDSGKSVALVPGGATEALYANPGKYVLCLSRRAGFIKLALETGAGLVPCFSFGENETFESLDSNNRVLSYIKEKFQYVVGLSLPIPTTIVPKKSPITVVVGDPIYTEAVEDPTDEQVQELLDKYIAAVRKLFDNYKGVYLLRQYRDVELTIM